MKASDTGIAPAFRFLALALTMSALLFTVAQSRSGMSGPKLVVLVIMDVLVVLVSALLWARRMRLEEEEVTVSGLFGSKTMRYDEVTEVDVMELKGRMMLVLTSNEKFVFVSSMFSAFPELVEKLLAKAGDDAKKTVEGLDAKKVERMHRMMILFLGGASLALVALALYEFLRPGVGVIPL